jgi:two-component system alkaline phosphatase synthesis response regulator PhoP
MNFIERRCDSMANILLIDDDFDFVDAVKTLLESKNYAVRVAYNGVEGWEKVKEQRPDLIILDVMMPQKDGYKTCAELKANNQYSDIPVILLTAVAEHVHETQYTARMGMEIEAEDYIPKPVEPSELLKRVEFLLNK